MLENYFEDFEVIEAQEEDIKFCMLLVARIIEGSTKKNLAPMALKLMIENLNLKNQSWQHHHCALLCISQIAEFVTESAQIDMIVFKIMYFVQSDFPKVAHTAIQCLGQIAENSRLQFQQGHAITVIPSVMSMLSDQSPRVISCALRTLAIIIDGCEKETVLRFSDKIMEHCIDFIQQSELVILVEGSLMVISRIAILCEKSFSTYNKGTREALRSFLNNSDQKFEYLREQAEETWSVLDQAVGKEELRRTGSVAVEKPEKMVEVQALSSDMGDVSTDYEIKPLAQARGKRANKKPVLTYEEKTVEEQKEKQKKTRNVTKKIKETRIKEEEEGQMEIEKPNSKLRTEIGYEWREWQLAFNEGLSSFDTRRVCKLCKDGARR